MGDGLKLSKDKRHRSSSSIAGVVVEGTRSERKLDLSASIAEDDQFALAEARCDELQEKIDLVKILKRKKKLKKRSMTKVNEVTPVDNIPFISVRTQPKKKVSQQAARMRRMEVPANPTRGYLDPATIEQHRMLGQVRGYNQNYRQPQNREPFDLRSVRTRSRRNCSEGDGACGQSVQMTAPGLAVRTGPTEVACGEDEINCEYSDNETYGEEYSAVNNQSDVYKNNKYVNRQRNYSRNGVQTASKWSDDATGSNKGFHAISSPVYRRRLGPVKQNSAAIPNVQQPPEERPVVEIFNKNRLDTTQKLRKPPSKPQNITTEKRTRKRVQPQKFDDEVTGHLENVAHVESKKDCGPSWHPRRVKYRSRRYELPTVASQMKQTGVRYYPGSCNYTNIPFVVSKSTAPSHNIGVNIQQVLNGMKIQQPLSGIPLTIAHHMGLGHISSYGAKSATSQQLSLDNREMNAIKLGRRLVRLPSYKYMSYSRLLSLYREGDGMVPRFLRAISRPSYFYTSMYNLATNREDLDGATSKGRGGNEARQSLAEYATLYREYEQIEKRIKETNNDPELERRKEQLSKELAAREEHIRKVVQDFRSTGDLDPTTLRASASTAEEYRPSTFKMNMTDQ